MLPVIKQAGSGDQALPQALGRLRVALDDAYVRASRELALTPQQAELLCAALNPASVGGLAAALHCDRSNVSRLVDRASMRGWIKRHGGEDDKRVTVIELTSDGSRVAHRFLAALQSQTGALRAEWPPQRRRLAVGVLNDIANALDAAGRLPLGIRPNRMKTKNARTDPHKTAPRSRRASTNR